jgi:hypothetical protein
VDTDFIEEKHVPGLHETHAELHSASLAIGYFVHTPVEIHVEDIEEMVASLLVSVSAHRVKKGRDRDVTANDGVRSPGRHDRASAAKTRTTNQSVPRNVTPEG